MMDSGKKVHCIACSVFEKVLNRIQMDENQPFTVEYISSMLHMHPEQLEAVIDKKLAENQKRDVETVLIFGDCHPHMIDQSCRSNTSRISGLNCAEIILGSDTYRRLRKEGAFFLLPEWVLRWEDVFKNELGLTAAVAKEMMREMHRILVYLDLGSGRIPRKKLKEISAFTGLPVRIHHVNPEHLKTGLERILYKEDSFPVLSSEQRKHAFQAMALDILEHILKEADHPEKLQMDMAVQMREFTGARVVILVQFMEEFGGSGHQVLVVEPARRNQMAYSQPINSIIQEARQMLKARILQIESMDPETWRFLHKEGMDLSITVPLHIGSRQVGAMLLLGLPDDHSIGMTLNMLDILATILALIFRNTLLLKRQEQIIESRTRQLKESEQRYRSLFDNMLHGFAYQQIITDEHGSPADYMYLEINDTFEKQTNLCRGDIVGKRVSEVFPEIKDDPVNWIELYGRVALQGQELRMEQYVKGLHKWFSVFAYCPAPGFFTTLLEDITERKRTELVLRHSELKFRELFNNVGDPIFIHNFQGRFIEVNEIACKLLGLSRNELLRITIKDIDAQSEQLTMDLRIETIRKMGALVYETQYKINEHQILPVEVHSRLIEYEGTEAVLSIARDISVRQQQEVQLGLLLKQKEVLLKEVYHRVKNNFMIVSSLLHLQSRSIADETVRAMFQASQNRVKTMALIHQQLYRASDLASVDFKGYLEQLVNSLRLSYGSGENRIQIVEQLDSIPVSVDKAIPCGLIMNELVTNALKYAFPGNRKGIIRIRFQKIQGNQIKLEVGDNGVGSPETVNMTKPETLGLQIVRMLSEQIKGKLTLHSGPGTRISVVFPFTGNPDE
ncbi:PAS domain S-box protein [bacterium]|nr:PAS domain S-box protein [bacterium]